jgi:hypothetical protein
MTSYRLFPSATGPSAPVSYTGPFLAGAVFCVTQPGMWFEGYWLWVCPSGQSTAPVKCALWSHLPTGAGGGILVPGSVVTSGTLTAGQWNYIPLTAPLQLSVGSTSSSPYTAAIGINGNFPDTPSQFGTGQPYAAGITNGPLFGYGTGVVACPYTSEPASVFSTAGADPALVMPQSQSLADNFWADAQVTDTAPPGYTGTYRLWPNKADTVSGTGQDSPVNYVVATEIRLSQACFTSKIWYYSPPGTVQLATAADIWAVTGTGTTGTRITGTTTPSWSGAAGSGWISCPLVTSLPAGTYKVSVYNGAATPDGWNAMTFGYFGVYSGNTANACGISGITAGPVSAPPAATASTAYEFLNSAVTTPPYTSGATEPGQGTFAIGPPGQYPYIYVDGLFQCYWVDLEVTPVIAGAARAAATAPVVIFPRVTPSPTAARAAGRAPVPLTGSIDLTVSAGPTASRAQAATGATKNDGTTAGPVTVNRSP